MVTWKKPHERRFEEQFSGPITPFGAEVEYHPNSAKDQARFRQFGKTVLSDLLWVVLHMWGEAGMETHSLRRTTHPQNISRSFNTKEVLEATERDNFKFPFANGSAKLARR